MSRKIIIDCDPGLDDARGILFLLSDPKINLLALTIVGGNVHAAVSSYNAGLVLEAMKRSDIPIFQGPSKNFSNEIIKSDYYFGKTGFGKLQLFSSTVQVRGDMEAYQALLEYGKLHKGEITLICTGPLTNLAKAFDKNEAIKDYFKQIYIMGGDRADKTEKNTNEYSEFNFYADPVAAETVLKNFGEKTSDKLFLFDWTLCLKYPLTLGFYRQIGVLLEGMGKDSMAQIFKEIPEKLKEHIPCDANPDPIDNFVSDEFAVVAAYDPTIITKKHAISCKSISRDQVTRGHCTFEDSEDGNIQLVDELNLEMFKQTFMNVLVPRS